MKKEQQTKVKTPLSFVLEVSKPHYKMALPAMALATVSAVLVSIVPFFFKKIIDSITVAEAAGIKGLLFWASIFITANFFSAMLIRAAAFFGARWATSARATGRRILSEYVTKHSHGYFADRFSGSLGSKINNASNGAVGLVNEFLWGWLGFAIGLVISFALVFYANVYVGLIFVAWFLAILPVNISLIKKKIPLGVAAQERETELRGQTVDILTNISAMLDYARRPFELNSLGRLIEIRRLAGLRNWMFSEKILVINTLIETVFVGSMIFVTIYFFSIGNITAGDIVLILALIMSVRNQLAFIGHRFNDFAETWSEVKEGLREVLIPHEIVDMPLSSKLNVSAGEIILDNVSFKYAEQQIFKTLNLHIAQGERIGLVGRSGVGKSTLMKLITRQYDISAGKITIDGQNISLVTQESLRNAIAIVPQDPLLFHRSIRENISYGKLDATDEEIEKVAKLSQANVFIKKLPKGYDTLVGERGIKLSGGERQRIAIARAFLKDAKVLLLDEATSSLDSASEKAIQGALEKLMKDKTVIAVAHRLSTLRAMDRIVVLDQGLIIENGTHDELLALGGIYAELWSHQAGGFIQEDE